ncbi:protein MICRORCHIDIA 7-like [Henckelia pumila]|uniref:protein MICRORCHIDIA 7-like n=1 Tax=Henckelia pumila TaxID=405737 RepID=UPI003C6E8A65
MVKKEAISFEDDDDNHRMKKKQRTQLPHDDSVKKEHHHHHDDEKALFVYQNCKQFWKAGDYEGSGCNGAGAAISLTAGIDHVRVHPKFLHSNATSHRWALGAFAELLDNALDEVCHGATYVNIDVLENVKDKSKILLVEDNGGGMAPDEMRQCMSLGYSAKSKLANTIGQYGNGFKTSTMRLGADVIVFSRRPGKTGGSATQSIGMLSFTFLQKTGKEDIVVPMIDYEKRGETWDKLVKSSSDLWQRNLETILQWSPYETEDDLLQQFKFLKDQGTRIIIYNLWEDDQGLLELDFDSDPNDIQTRGASRDAKKIEMANIYPNCKHFFTFQHSLRNYASILYLRIPPGFRIILRGMDINHHNIVDDLMVVKEVTYRPAASPDTPSRNQNMAALITLGFVKDATHHIDVQGFNVYHKNRLIKPFWRVWNAAGSDGRGAIGVLEANFVEPAHNKQGFERTTALSRLEARLIHVQKAYWSSNCHKIGYAPRRQPKKSISPEKAANLTAHKNKSNVKSKLSGNAANSGVSTEKSPVVDGIDELVEKENFSNDKAGAYTADCASPASKIIGTSQCEEAQAITPINCYSSQDNASVDTARNSNIKKAAARSSGAESGPSPSMIGVVLKLKEENICLRESLKNAQIDLQFAENKNKSLQNQLQEERKKMQKMDEEQEVFVSSFLEERSRRNIVEENLKKSLKDASGTIQALLDKVKPLESR